MLSGSSHRSSSSVLVGLVKGAQAAFRIVSEDHQAQWWQAEVEGAVTNHADLLDRREREAVHFRTEISMLKQELAQNEKLEQELAKTQSRAKERFEVLARI